MNRIVTTLPQLQQLQTDTYIYSVVILFVAFILAFGVANLIPYQGGKDQSYIKRRIWFIAIGLIGSFGYWIYNQTVVMGTIQNAGFKNMFATSTYYSLAIISLGYLAIGLIVMFSFRYSKFGSIIGKIGK